MNASGGENYVMKRLTCGVDGSHGVAGASWLDTHPSPCSASASPV